MDFRELSGFIDGFTSNTDIGAQKLREWQCEGSNVAILDLKRAYLQLHIHKSLWPRGRGIVSHNLDLNVALMIMQSIMSSLMSHERAIQ